MASTIRNNYDIIIMGDLSTYGEDGKPILKNYNPGVKEFGGVGAVGAPLALATIDLIPTAKPSQATPPTTTPATPHPPYQTFQAS